MVDPIDRHVEAQDLWEDLNDDRDQDDGDFAADLEKDGGMTQLELLTGQWAEAAELASKRMREMYDKVRPGPGPDTQI